MATCLAVLIGAVTLVAGYLIGASVAHDTNDANAARARAAHSSYVTARRRAIDRSRDVGLQHGMSAGRKDARAKGRASGAKGGAAAAEAELASIAAEEAAAAEAAQSEELVCDGAIADDAMYEACLRQSGSSGHLNSDGMYVP